MAAAAKTFLDAGIADWYFYQQPSREHAWRAYCVIGQLSSLVILGLTLPDARTGGAALRAS